MPSDVAMIVPELPRINPHVAAALLTSSPWKAGGSVMALFGLAVRVIVVRTSLDVSAAIADTDATIQPQ